MFKYNSLREYNLSKNNKKTNFFKGIGLHSGKESNVTIMPGDESSGTI